MTVALAPRSIVIDDFLPARRSLRIAVVSETWPPEVNGVATTIARIVEGLRVQRHAVQLVRPRQDDAERAALDVGFAEVLMRGLPIPRYPQLKMGLPARRELIELWSRHRPDVVHLVTEGPLGRSALQAALHLRLPVVSDFRTNFHAYSRHYGMRWLAKPILGYLRGFHNRTSCTMVPAEGLRAELAASGFRNLKVVARGVDTRLFDPARRRADLRLSWGAVPDAPVALCVGRLAAEKNLDLAVDAYTAMRTLNAATRLVFVGDGPARTRLYERCPEAIFAGIRRGEELAEHYASADVFLFPSLTETFGNVVPEAMASGLAVVAFDYAAAAQLIREGDNGLLAPCRDPQAFVEQARRLAADGDTTRRLARRARVAAQGLDWSGIVSSIVTEYEHAIDGIDRVPRRVPAPAGLPA